MKKLIVLLLFLIVFLSGCVEPNNPDTINQQKVDAVIMHIDILPIEITVADREYIEETRALYDALNDQEKALVTNIGILENAEAVILAYDTEVTETNEALDLAQATIDNLIPGIVEDDLQFPSKLQSDQGEISVLWASSNPYTISNTGKVTQGRRNISVTLTTTLVLGEYRKTFTQVATVKALVFTPLPTSHLAFAYVTSSSSFTDLTTIAKNTVNVVNYAFARVTDEGEVSVLGLSRLEYVLALRKQGIRVMMCIGGYADGAVPFSKAAQTQAGREKLAASIVDAVEKYHFDGVDIDWEYPGFYTSWNIGLLEDRANYTLLMQEIRTQLKAANFNYLITAAVPGGVSLPSRYNLTDLNPILDYFLLMTYDLDAADTSTHHTNLYTSTYSASSQSVHQSVLYYLDNGVSPSKLVIGAAFYGRAFTLASTGAIMRASATARQSITFSAIQQNYLNNLSSPNITRYWDDVAKAPYVYNSTTNVVVTYDDPESIRYKCEYIITNQLAGIMFWEYSQDNTNSLMQAIYDHLTSQR